MVIKTRTTIRIITNKTMSIAYDCVVSSQAAFQFYATSVTLPSTVVSQWVRRFLTAHQHKKVTQYHSCWFTLENAESYPTHEWQSSYGRRPPRCVGETVRPAVNKSHSVLQNTSCGYCHHGDITPAVLLAYWSPVERNWTLYDGDGGILDTERWHQNAD